MTRDEFRAELLAERRELEQRIEAMVHDFSKKHGLIVSDLVLLHLNVPIAGQPRNSVQYKIGVNACLPASFRMPELPEDG